MSGPARDELLAVLDALEEADARNLAWGLTDESWTRDGLAEFIGRHGGRRRPAGLHRRASGREPPGPAAEGVAGQVPD